MRRPRASTYLLLALFLGNTLAKSPPSSGGVEVLIKVQVFDNSDLSPLGESSVQVCGNQSVLASSVAGGDGIVLLTILYQPGTWVIVMASKSGFITNSAPWQASRLPLYAAISLYLLPQRPATLLLYDDVVQLLSGSPGSRRQPWVQLQRNSLRPTLNASLTPLSAMLTSSRSQHELGGFPYPLASHPNSTGTNSSWTELTTVAAICALLAGPNGTEVQVTEPIHISMPLPPDSPLKSATTVPLWRFEDKTGLWVRGGVGYVKNEDSQMTWSFVAPSLGYWLAAFPSSSGTGLNTSGLRDITTYHTIFLLAILGAMALLVLILLCLLLYYCRRRCLKPRKHRRKSRLSSSLESSRRDQGTSTSHLNLISSGHMETASSSGDPDAVKSDFSSIRGSGENFFRPVQKHPDLTREETLPLKATRATNTRDPLLQTDYSSEDLEERRYHLLNAKENQGYSSDPPSPPFAGHYQDRRPPEYYAEARPGSVSTQPGQLIFCHSMEQMKESMYQSMVPTLVIPAHYMHLSAMEQAMERQQQLQQDMDGLQVCMTLPPQQPDHQRQQQPGQGEQQEASSQKEEERNRGAEQAGGPVRIPVLFNDSTIAQMNGELQAMTEKKLLELGVKPHPRAWFVSLDGRSNSLVRHSYIELSNDGLRLPLGGLAQDHQSSQRKVKEESKTKAVGDRKAHGKIYSKLPVIETPESSSEGPSAMYSPEENSTGPLLDQTPESRGGTFPRKGRSRDNSTRSSTSEVHRDSQASPEDDTEAEDRDEDGENKKSPWQKREERPLMVFNVK